MSGWWRIVVTAARAACRRGSMPAMSELIKTFMDRW